MIHPDLGKFTGAMLFVIISIIIVFFGGFMLMINLLSGSDSLGFINVFFGIFIVITVLMMVFAYFASNSIPDKTSGIQSQMPNKMDPIPPKITTGKVAALLCSSCGGKVNSKDKFCLECGSPLN